MSNLALRSIARQVRDLNVAKRGATSLYVDGTDGSDTYTGGSWVQAFATIQHAVDVADSWTQIFIRAGTYEEEVNIPSTKDSIQLIGAHRDSTIVTMPSSGTPITIRSNNCVVQGLCAKTQGTDNSSINLFGSNHRIKECLVDGTANYGNGIAGNGNNVIIDDVKSTSAHTDGIWMASTSSYWEIQNCHFDGVKCGIWLKGDFHKVHDNEIRNATSHGIYIESGDDNNSIFHNNIVSNTNQIEDAGSNNKFFENFYDDHTNIDNGFGIATAPYAFTGGSDLRPVVVRDGWNSISLLRSLLRKKTAAQTSQAATDANGTAWVDLKSIAPTTSDIELYRLKMTTAGTWAGTAKYRIIIGATKVYPFTADKNIDTAVIEDFIFPINIQINESAKIQFRSDNAGDGAGDTVALNQLDYATVI